MAQDAAKVPPRRTSRGKRRRNKASGPPPASNGCYGALDLGTNNCRLLIARPDRQEGFTVIDAFSRIVRLGEGLATSGRLSQESMDRAVSALSVCSQKLRRRNVTLARSVATEACRRAANGRQFVDRVRRETGIALDIIAPQEEARLAVLGCHKLLGPGDGPAVIFDIGGGSTELVLVEPDGDLPKIRAWWSAPWGVVSLTESEGRENLEGKDRLAAYERMRNRAREGFARFSEWLPKDRDDIRLLGTSGTVTTLASVYLELPSYDRRAVDGLHVPIDAMRDISQYIAKADFDGRAALPCIGSERADMVVAGCAILEAILDIWPAGELGIADRGIREGILRSLMARDGYRM
ncbi:Ppx/GppA phosphatase family protein [Sphingomicrobium sediminis]|uniref:Ppx/GppA family phosphatase n=1 Tax=Sphingomicrobium sediminis TaxID=2950949 RepID=A0A9X2ELA9_9SPHN|nr:Ppx/GppA phosphatase family protein [Sphingomicrobium sediminis]MCM8557444.1 Ppx/GppA family phosphatase [Sphingomicrobium sediminis]